MQIYLASNREKLIDFEHHIRLQGAFDNAEKEFMSNITYEHEPFTLAWAENYSGNWELWCIILNGADQYSHQAKLTPFEVEIIEVFGE